MKTRNVHELFTATDVVNLLLPLITRRGESKRGAELRVRGVLRYALKQGWLPKRRTLPGLQGQQFLLGEVMALARENRSWRLMESGRAARYPAIIRESVGVKVRATDAVEVTVTPGDRARMVELLKQSQGLLREKDSEILRLRERISVLELLASRRVSFRAASGKRGSWNDNDAPGV